MSQYIELKLPLSVIKETDSIGKLNDVNIFTALDGEKNIHIGANHSTTGTDDSGSNISIGDSSLGSLTDGANNIALGKDSAEDLTTGDNNIVIGTNAQPSSVSINNEITFGDANITSLRIPGLSSGASTNDVLTYDGSKIVLAAPSVPTIELDDLTDAFHSGGSIGIGTDALRDEASNGFRNVGIGYRSLSNHTSGDDNVALGYDSLLSLDGDNSQNTFVGSMVGQLRTSGSGNSAVGYKSQGGFQSTGDNNTSLGANTLINLQGGHSNVAIGKDAGDSVTSGFQNTLIGMDAGEAITGGDNNICIGYNAQASASTVNNEITLGDTNITSLRIPGLSSGATNGDVLTWNGTNITLAAAGGGGASDIDGLSDAINDSTDKNLGLGENAINSITSAINTIGIGYDAGTAITTGNSNLLIGQSAGKKISTGGENIAIGSRSMEKAVTTNTSITMGVMSSFNMTGGSDNTVIGQGGAWSLTTGSNNTVIGAGADVSVGTVQNEITLGDNNVTVLRTNGSIMPFTDNAQDLGSTSLQWQNIYTGDLHLSNERHKEGNSVDGTTGNWTIQEGAEDLFIINNKNGKKFKFCLKEIA